MKSLLALWSTASVYWVWKRRALTREYPADWKPGDEPYYPVNDARNTALYEQYAELAKQEGKVVFAGRLGGYKYYDMDKAVAAAFVTVQKELGVNPGKELVR